MHNHPSARSFLVAEPSPGPLLKVGVDVCSTTGAHKVRVEVPPNSRQALAATLISAFHNINQLIVHAGEKCFFFSDFQLT
jgi:hypothetical protein